MPSLVICPNTLTYQWKQEINKFFKKYELNTQIYDSQNREHIWATIDEIDVIIVSYERARSDINQPKGTSLADQEYFYLVLDEGHKIKTNKSKVT